MNGHARITLVTGALLALGLAACADPELAPPDASETPVVSSTAPGAEPPDPRDAELTAEVAALRSTLEAARTALAEAQQSAQVPAARAAAEHAVRILTAHPDLAEDLDGDGTVRTLEVTPLLPGPREAIDEDAFYGDQLSRTLTAARAAGADGGAVVDVLRDPIVGDLGAWQADADAILDLIDRTADPRDLDAVETALPDIPGHAAKALTYALAAVRSDDLDTVHTAAERAQAHLDLTISALQELSSD